MNVLIDYDKIIKITRSVFFLLFMIFMPGSWAVDSSSIKEESLAKNTEGMIEQTETINSDTLTMSPSDNSENTDKESNYLLMEKNKSAMTATRPAAYDPMANSGKVILFLLLIVGLIVFLAWLINKTRATQFGLGQAQLRTIAMLSLGTKEKVAIIDAGGKHLVIGITPNQITLLSELNEKIEQTPAAPLGFAEILKKAVTK